MSGLLGVDFGERRIGLAWTSSENGFPSAVCTIVRHSDADAVQQIVAMAMEYGADLVVLGEPVGLDGSQGSNCDRVRRFAAKLSQACPLEIVFLPETLTTVAAGERLASMGIKPARFKPGIDALAAAVLLEEFLALSPPERSNLRGLGSGRVAPGPVAESPSPGKSPSR
jgi:putative Holliday junction resolvase